MITYILVAAVSGITAAGAVTWGSWLTSEGRNAPPNSALNSRINAQTARIERVIEAVDQRVLPIEDRLNSINGHLVSREEVAAAFQAAAEAEERRQLALIEAEQAEAREQEALRRQAEEEQRQIEAIEQWQAQQREAIRQELLAEQRRRGAAGIAQLAQQQAETPGVQVRFARPELGIPEPLERESPWEEGQG